MVGSVVVGAGGVYDLGYHVVWCPKYWRPVLVGSIRERCEALIRAKCTGHGWTVVALEVMPDQVHVLVKTHPKHSPSFIANQIKAFA